jgi:hypothetical protein
MARIAVAAFDCGSDGSDGALAFSAGTSATLNFDPATVISGRVLDADGDGVYNFTSISIPANVTLRFPADKSGWSPIYFLSQGDVIIEGKLNFSGAKGHDASTTVIGDFSIPGSGGSPGSIGRVSALDFDGVYAPDVPNNNYFLYPFYGGDGGSYNSSYDFTSGAGAGGGALLLASNTKITVNGSLLFNGGDAGAKLALPPAGKTSHQSYAGDGGAARLIAPVFNGSGLLSAAAGASTYGSGTKGCFRVESGTYGFTGTVVCNWMRSVALIPSAVYGLPTSAQSKPAKARLVRIGGIDVPAKPTGLFTIPDVIMNSNTDVLFEIEASNIPVGTTFRIYLWNESNQMNSYTSEASTGTEASSVAIKSITVPNGYSRCFVTADWTNP